MATCLCHQNGRMECWNAGILGIKVEINHFICKKLLQTHHSITPLFHYSNWGEAPKFLLVVTHFNRFHMREKNNFPD